MNEWGFRQRAIIGYTGPGEPAEDGEMTLPSDTGFEIRALVV